MTLFKTPNIQIVRYCQTLFDCELPSVLFIYLILKLYPKHKIDRDIADNADKNRKKTSKKHTGHM